MSEQPNPARAFSLGEIQDSTFDALLALILGLGSFLLYLLTLAPTVLFADGGEFQFVPYILGIAHPPGYPLYLLLGWLWSHALPIGDVAYRMNLFSAWWAAIAVGLSYLLGLRLAQRAIPRLDPIAARLAGMVAAATFAVGTTFWSQAVIAEVYSFNAFFVAVVLLLTFRLVTPTEDGEASSAVRISPQARRSLALAFVFGLSLTHHYTMLLLLPGILAFLWLVRSPPQSQYQRPAAPETRPLTLLAPRSLLRRVGFALTLLLVFTAPLLLYLYLPLRAPHTPYATLQLSDIQTLTLYENTWRGFVEHLTASAFASNLALPSISAGGILWGRRLGMAWSLLRQQVGLVGIGLALIGLGRLIVDRRWALLALTGLGYGAGVAFNLIYQIGDVEVLFIPSYLFLSLWLGLGVATLAQGLAAGLIRWKGERVVRADFGQQGYQQLVEGIRQLVVRGGAALFLIVPIVLLATHYAAVDQSANREARDVWQSILAQPIPQGAALISNDRNEIMPLWYYQHVEGRRPDLLGLFPLIVADPTYAHLGGVVDQALVSGRPVYLIKPMPGLEVKAQLQPAEDMPPLVRLTAPAMERPPAHPRQVILDGVMRLVGYDQSLSSARAGDQLAITLYWQPQSEVDFDYSSYVHLVDQAGQGITQSDHQPGGDYYPTSQWQPGEVLRDRHLLTMPQDIAPGIYRLVVGMYRHPSLEPLGAPVETGLLAVKDAASVQTTLPPDVQHRTEVEFGERITLLGYNQVLQDDQLDLTLFWQAEHPLDRNWTVFVHLLNGDGTLVSQHDGQPREGHYPTSVWDQGEVIDDHHVVSLPLDVPDGEYRVAVGLYAVESGERLPVLDQQGNQVGDNSLLGTLTLTDDEWRVE